MDFSECSRCALEHAVRLAQWNNAGLRIIHVIQQPSLDSADATLRQALDSLRERMREEADATAKEKQAKAKASAKEPKPAKKGAHAPAVASRMKIVWAVCAVNGSIVRTFPYSQKASAEAEVARLCQEAPHHLRAEKVPFDD